MRNPLFLLSAIVLLFSTCKKQEDTADFYCKVNNEKWIVYNTAVTGAGVDITITNTQPKMFFLSLFTSPHDEGILESLSLNIQPFNDNGIYGYQQMGCGGSSKKTDANGLRTNYELDTTQAASFTVSTFKGNNTIIGSFNFTLKVSGANSLGLPEKLVITDGHFNTGYFVNQ